MVQIGDTVRSNRDIPGTIENDLVINDPLAAENRTAMPMPQDSTLVVVDEYDPGSYKQTATAQSDLRDDFYATGKNTKAKYTLYCYNVDGEPERRPIPHSHLTEVKPDFTKPPNKWLPTPCANALEEGTFVWVMKPFNPDNGLNVKIGTLIFIASGICTRTGQPTPDRTKRLNEANYFFKQVKVSTENKIWLSDHFLPPSTFR